MGEERGFIFRVKFKTKVEIDRSRQASTPEPSIGTIQRKIDNALRKEGIYVEKIEVERILTYWKKCKNCKCFSVHPISGCSKKGWNVAPNDFCEDFESIE